MNPDEQEIPTTTREAIESWVHHGPPPGMLGSFIRALLTNNLKEAVLHADPTNAANLCATVRWIYNHVPGLAWGSAERLVEWHRFKSGKAA